MTDNRRLEKDIDTELATSLSRFSHCETADEIKQLAYINSDMPALAAALVMGESRRKSLVGKPAGFKEPIYPAESYLEKMHANYLFHTPSVNQNSRKGLVSILEAGLKRRQFEEMGVRQRIKAILKGDDDDVFH